MLLFVLLLLLFINNIQCNEIYIDYNNGDIRHSSNPFNNYAVYGNLINNVNNSGWNSMDLIMIKNDNITKLEYSNNYYALGFAEGFLSCIETNQFYANFASDVFGKGIQPGTQTITFMNDNYLYLLDMINKNKDIDDYWFEISLLVLQIQGMLEGYNKANCVDASLGSDDDYTNLNKATMTKFLLLMGFGDLYQITKKLLEPGQFSRERGSRSPLFKDKKRRIVERCSAMIKLLDNDIIFGHNTWDSYESAAPRIFKHLQIPVYGKGVVYDTYFSSSPGLLSSVDDFYTLKGQSNLAVLETTNSLFNLGLLKKVQSSSVLSFMRVMVSNKLATGGQSWSELFSKEHSGTYTNQWMIIDIDKFEPGNIDNSNKDYLFTVLEEVPGMIVYRDLTKVLTSQKYWPSYNYPYYKEIQDASGYQKICEFDENNCYDTVPRAKIFKANHESVSDINSFKNLMQLNDYPKNDACDAIACRGDLEEVPGAFGAIDAKVGSIMSIKNNEKPSHYVKLGPTTDQQKPFCWSYYSMTSELKDDGEYTHKGSYDCYDFEWQILPLQ